MAAWRRGLGASLARPMALPLVLAGVFALGLAISGGRLPDAAAWLPVAPPLAETAALTPADEAGGTDTTQDPPGIRRVSFQPPPPPLRPETLAEAAATGPLTVEDPTVRVATRPAALDALVGHLAARPAAPPDRPEPRAAAPDRPDPRAAARADIPLSAPEEPAAPDTPSTASEDARAPASGDGAAGEGAVYLASAAGPPPRPLAGPTGRPRVAIVIDDLGLHRGRTAATLALPGPITVAFLPYADGLPRWSDSARGAGHEVIVHLPMQPLDGSIDAGPDALTVGLPPEEIARRVGAALDAVPGAVGLNNHMGSRFTRWPEGMATVAAILRDRGYFFLDSRTIPDSVAFTVAHAAGVPAATRNVFLDHRIDPASVARQLAAVEAEARQNGSAIAIGHPHRVTLTALAAWLPGLADRGFDLVPVSALLSR